MVKLLGMLRSLNCAESGASASSAFAGRHDREDGEGRLEYFREQPLLHSVRGRQGTRDPDDPRAGDQPVCGTRLSGLRDHGP